MIQIILLVMLGFLVASLLALLAAIPFHRRTVRLTRQRLEATMPMTIAEIQAEKDLLRAEYAVRIRRTEIAREKDREKAARYLVERNRNQMTINALKAELKALGERLSEHENECTVLEQTIRKRIPELEAQLERARQIIAARDRELARMGVAYDNQTEALGIAKLAAQRYSQELEKLREALDEGSRAGQRRGKRGDDAETALARENQHLQAELSRLRQQLAELKEIEVADNALLRSEMHKLVKQMMGAPAALKPKPDTVAAEPPPVATAAASGGKLNGMERERGPGDKEPTGGKRSASGKPLAGKARVSLTERLKKLTAKAQA